MDETSSASGAASRVLPEKANLDHIKREAKSHLSALRVTEPNAQLARAQFLIARAYGFRSWRALRAEVVRRQGGVRPSSNRPDLDACVGYYRFEDDLVRTVTRDGESLFEHSRLGSIRYVWNGTAWADTRNPAGHRASFSLPQDGFCTVMTLHFQMSGMPGSVDITGRRVSLAEAEEFAKVHHCSFCGKSQHAVTRLFVGPATAVCNECVALLAEPIAGPTASSEGAPVG